MSSFKALFILAGSILVLMLSLMGFNYFVDPQCYYGCKEVDPAKRTLNTYYRVAQKIQAFPDTKVIILGSSRGETTSPLWVESLTGLRTLNLSAAGSELSTKLTFIKIAQEKTQLQKVIWFADYFELISENVDRKLVNTPALRKYLTGTHHEEGLTPVLRDLQGLLDHNTLEASLYFFNSKENTILDQGMGSDIDYALCQSSEFKGKETPESLKKEVDLLYQNYSERVIRPPQNPGVQEEFLREMAALETQGVEVIVIIMPYHPDFLKRLKNEHGDIYQRHQDWISKVKGLSAQGVQVLNYFEGIPGDDGSPRFWNDGVHFTCRSSMLMLQPIVRTWR